MGSANETKERPVVPGVLSKSLPGPCIGGICFVVWDNLCVLFCPLFSGTASETDNYFSRRVVRYTVP